MRARPLWLPMPRMISAATLSCRSAACRSACGGKSSTTNGTSLALNKILPSALAVEFQAIRSAAVQSPKWLSASAASVDLKLPVTPYSQSVKRGITNSQVRRQVHGGPQRDRDMRRGNVQKRQRSAHGLAGVVDALGCGGQVVAFEFALQFERDAGILGAEV